MRMIADAKCLELDCWMGTMEAKPGIPQHAARYVSKPSKLECFSCRVGVNEQDKEPRFDGKVEHQFRGLARGRVCECTARAGIAHAGDIGVHSQPILSEANVVEGAVIF
jgi:hypothetical protein